MDERRWSARSDVFARSSATAMILLPAEGPGIKLNGPAQVVWELTSRESSTDQVAAEVAEAFGEPVEAVRPFVLDTLQLLHDHDVVDVR